MSFLTRKNGDVRSIYEMDHSSIHIFSLKDCTVQHEKGFRFKRLCRKNKWKMEANPCLKNLGDAVENVEVLSRTWRRTYFKHLFLKYRAELLQNIKEGSDEIGLGDDVKSISIYISIAVKISEIRWCKDSLNAGSCCSAIHRFCIRGRNQLQIWCRNWRKYWWKKI